MRITHPLKRLLPVLTLLLCTGCNGDVFIDEFLPQAPAPVSLTEEASETTIRFEADNWEVKSIGGPSPSEYLDYRIDKCDGRTLKLSLLQNLYEDPCELTVYVGNDYEQWQITVTLHPTSKYQVDSIAYDWSRFDFYDYMLEAVQELTVINKEGTSPVSWTCYPYQYSKRKVTFTDLHSYKLDEDWLRHYLGQPLPEITIPDAKDGQPAMGATKASFGIFEQELEVDLDKTFFEEVPVDAGKNIHITVYNNMDTYSVPFTLYASHPRTGKHLEIAGILRSECPVDYMILKNDVTDEQP